MPQILMWLMGLAGLGDFIQNRNAAGLSNERSEEGLDLGRDAVANAPEPLNIRAFGQDTGPGFPGEGKPLHAGTNILQGSGTSDVNLDEAFNSSEGLRDRLGEFTPIEQPDIDFSSIRQGTSFEDLLSQSGAAGLVERAQGRFPDLSAQRASRLGGLAQRSARQEELATQSVVSSGNSLEAQRDNLENLRFDAGAARGRAAGDIESNIEGQRNEQAGILAGLEGLQSQIQGNLAGVAANDAFRRDSQELGLVGAQALQAPDVDKFNAQFPLLQEGFIGDSEFRDANATLAGLLGLRGQDIGLLGQNQGMTVELMRALESAGIDVTQLGDIFSGVKEGLLLDRSLERPDDGGGSGFGLNLGFG